MVLRLKALEGVLRNYSALLEIVVTACEHWEFEPPFGEKVVEVCRVNLEAVQSLRDAGIEEVKVPEKY